MYPGSRNSFVAGGPHISLALYVLLVPVARRSRLSLEIPYSTTGVSATVKKMVTEVVSTDTTQWCIM